MTEENLKHFLNGRYDNFKEMTKSVYEDSKRKESFFNKGSFLTLVGLSFVLTKNVPMCILGIFGLFGALFCFLFSYQSSNGVMLREKLISKKLEYVFKELKKQNAQHVWGKYIYNQRDVTKNLHENEGVEFWDYLTWEYSRTSVVDLMFRH